MPREPEDPVEGDNGPIWEWLNGSQQEDSQKQGEADEQRQGGPDRLDGGQGGL